LVHLKSSRASIGAFAVVEVSKLVCAGVLTHQSGKVAAAVNQFNSKDSKGANGKDVALQTSTASTKSDAPFSADDSD
jgi:hypothetical protein